MFDRSQKKAELNRCGPLTRGSMNNGRMANLNITFNGREKTRLSHSRAWPKQVRSNGSVRARVSRIPGALSVRLAWSDGALKRPHSAKRVCSTLGPFRGALGGREGH